MLHDPLVVEDDAADVPAVEASTDRRALIVDFYETGAPAYRILSPLFAQGWPVIDTSDLVLAVWSVLLVVSAVVAWRVERRSDRGDQPPASGVSIVDQSAETSPDTVSAGSSGHAVGAGSPSR